MMLLNCGAGDHSLGLQGDQNSQSLRKSTLNIHWKDWCWSWNSNTLATWYEELTHLKRVWCWDRLKGQGEGEDRGWDGWIASLTRWTWVCVSSGVGDGHGSLACCSPWGCKESDRTEWNELNWILIILWFLFDKMGSRIFSVPSPGALCVVLGASPHMGTKFQ